MIQKLQARQNNFRKAERLCCQKSLAELHEQGQAFLVYPIRCVYRRVESTDEPLRILVGVPKRHQRRAVHRNLLKRRIREAYRLNRHILRDTIMEKEWNDNKKLALDFSLSYISKEILDYNTIENAVKKILTELTNRATVTTD